jgi:hypothetical protein
MGNPRILLIFLLLVFLVITGFLFYKFSDEEQTLISTNPAPSNIIEETEESDLIEEEDADESKHDLKISIISPEGETFETSQARFYKALAEGNFKYDNQVRCNWEFFLNQNNEEALYQTMENKSILSEESQDVCGFTSTFIEDAGVLRVKLTMTVYDRLNENIESVTAERVYTVAK